MLLLNDQVNACKVYITLILASKHIWNINYKLHPNQYSLILNPWRERWWCWGQEALPKWNTALEKHPVAIIYNNIVNRNTPRESGADAFVSQSEWEPEEQYENDSKEKCKSIINLFQWHVVAKPTLMQTWEEQSCLGVTLINGCIWLISHGEVSST